MGLRDLVYRLYERRLEASLSGHSIPRHVGVILDGNRRWARSAGLADVSYGHQKGADHIFELLGWCRQAGVEVVTLWLLSTDNLARPAAEVEALLADHRGHRAGAGRPGLARQAGWGARPAAGGDGAGAQGRGRGHRGQPRAAGQRGGRVRRAAGDRGRGPLAAPRPRHQGHQHRGTRRDPRRGAHRRPPVHGGPARPRPGDPDLGGAAAGRVPAVAERPLGVLLLRRLLAGLPAGRFPARPALYAARHRRFGS